MSEITSQTMSGDGISLESKSPCQDKDSSLVSRKVSAAFSETDSGYGNEEDSLETGVEKKVIRPDHEVISRLCNFDEEEEDELSEGSSSDSNEDNDSDHDDGGDAKVTLTLIELRHIMSALVHEHVEARLDCAELVLQGRRCSVCSGVTSLSSLMILGTGARCELCSFVVCSHCSKEVELLTPGQTFSVPVSQLTPDSVASFTRHQANTFSSLSASSLMSDYDPRSSSGSMSVSSPGPRLTWLASKVRRWSRPSSSLLCAACCQVVTQTGSQN